MILKNGWGKHALTVKRFWKMNEVIMFWLLWFWKMNKENSAFIGMILKNDWGNYALTAMISIIGLILLRKWSNQQY